MPIEIHKDISERITAIRFKELLRKHSLPISGNKNELIVRIQNAVNGGLGQTSLDITTLDEFLVGEISHGKNRIMFISSFPLTVGRFSEVTIRNSLIAKQLPAENFNNIRAVIRPEELTLTYLNLKEHEERAGQICKVSMCFAFTTHIEGYIDNNDDYIPPTSETDYVWVDILPENELIIIKLRPRSNNYFENNAKTKDLYMEVSTKIREIFSLPPRGVESVKHTLYKIFKDLTKAAEEPFKQRVMPLHEQIRQFASQCAQELGLPTETHPIDIPHRVFRLLERALIQQDFNTYQSYSVGKRGIVDRLHYSDPTGAAVRARSGQADDGIAVTDIYFDTRDTIEQMQRFDKIWVTWFYRPEPLADVEKIPTKIEVFRDYFILHLLYSYTTREVEEHVLSNLRYYEELPN